MITFWECVIAAVALAISHIIGWRRGWNAGADMAIRSLNETKSLGDAIDKASRIHNEIMRGWSIKP